MGKSITFPSKEEVSAKNVARKAYMDKLQAKAVQKSNKDFYSTKKKPTAKHKPSKYIPRIGADNVMREGTTLRTDWNEKKKLNKMSAAERAKYRAMNNAKNLGSKAGN